MRQIAKTSDGRVIMRCFFNDPDTQVLDGYHAIDERREVFERDCLMQGDLWDSMICTREDTTKNGATITMPMRRREWAMVRRCNGIE